MVHLSSRKEAVVSNVQKAQEMYAAFGRGDIGFILNGLAPDVSWEVQGPEHIALFGKRKGREQVAGFFQTLVGLLDVEQFEPREFVAQGEYVVVVGKERGRGKATGRVMEGEWVHVWKFKDGHAV